MHKISLWLTWTCVPEAGIRDRDKSLHHTDTEGCSYLSLPLIVTCFWHTRFHMRDIMSKRSFTEYEIRSKFHSWEGHQFRNIHIHFRFKVLSVSYSMGLAYIQVNWRLEEQLLGRAIKIYLTNWLRSWDYYIFASSDRLLLLGNGQNSNWGSPYLWLTILSYTIPPVFDFITTNFNVSRADVCSGFRDMTL